MGVMWGSVPQIDDRVVVDDDLGAVIVSRETMTLGPGPAIVGWGFSIWSGGVVVRQLYCRHQ